MRLPQQNKVCTHCGIIKPRSDYYTKTKTTIYPYCKVCAVYINKLGHIKYYDKDKKHEYYIKNKEKIIKNVKSWNKNHPEQRSQYMVITNAIRRGRIKNNGGTFTAKEFYELINKYDGCCAYCGAKTKLSVDHFIPISKGGMNTIDNIRPCCLKCNISKGNKDPDIWLNTLKPILP